jgi:hypothetical protein
MLNKKNKILGKHLDPPCLFDTHQTINRGMSLACLACLDSVHIRMDIRTMLELLGEIQQFRHKYILLGMGLGYKDRRSRMNHLKRYHICSNNPNPHCKEDHILHTRNLVSQGRGSIRNYIPILHRKEDRIQDNRIRMYHLPRHSNHSLDRMCRVGTVLRAMALALARV